MATAPSKAVGPMALFEKSDYTYVKNPYSFSNFLFFYICINIEKSAQMSNNTKYWGEPPTNISLWDDRWDKSPVEQQTRNESSRGAKVWRTNCDTNINLQVRK